jgi:RAB protein geranylgeranyltransferase component A
LQEAEAWAADQSSPKTTSIFSAASISKPAANLGLSFSRAYSLTLSPQLIHARSALLSQLVSSRAFRQIEFLAVGSFFIFKPPAESSRSPGLARIPSTREDVFSTAVISAREKRQLMKFLKFVVDWESAPQTELWQPHAEKPLAEFLETEFNLNQELRTYIISLTLSLDGRVSTRDGLGTVHRYLSSMGMFGPGFAAVYPKWGGACEIAQVACRAGAVGGGVYMLGTGIKGLKPSAGAAEETELELTNGMTVKTRLLVKGLEETTETGMRISRLVAVVGSPLTPLFEVVVEGAPTPAVSVVAFPPGSVRTEKGASTENPVYALVHSSDTGECPAGQSESTTFPLSCLRNPQCSDDHPFECLSTLSELPP